MPRRWNAWIPRKLDRALLMSLVEKHGDPDLVAALQARDGHPDNDASLTGGIDDLDDFSACRISRKEDWVDLYAKPFYFGCEADDRTNAWAFSRNNPFGSKLNAIYSSDIGHFDVVDMRDPLPEAYELVEDGLISAGQLPRLHVCQRRSSVGHTESAVLRGDCGRSGRGGGTGARARAGGGEVERGEVRRPARAGLRPTLFPEPAGTRIRDSVSGAALALRERDQRIMDAPVDLDALAREARALAIRALAGNADLVDALLPRRRLDGGDLRGQRAAIVFERASADRA